MRFKLLMSAPKRNNLRETQGRGPEGYSRRYVDMNVEEGKLAWKFK